MLKILGELLNIFLNITNWQYSLFVRIFRIDYRAIRQPQILG